MGAAQSVGPSLSYRATRYSAEAELEDRVVPLLHELWQLAGTAGGGRVTETSGRALGAAICGSPDGGQSWWQRLTAAVVELGNGVEEAPDVDIFERFEIRELQGKQPSEARAELQRALDEVRAALQSEEFKAACEEEAKAMAGVALGSAPPPDFKFKDDDFADLVGCSGGCSIALTEERAISLGQLQKVYAHIERFCEPRVWVNRFGRKLTARRVNLYEATSYVLKPATAKLRCSFVELVASGPQPPDYFVSHWWGEPVVKFLDCLEKHAIDRGLVDVHTMQSTGARQPFYWVCAYANNQWKLDEAISADPKHSSFFQAMRLARGTLMVVDLHAVCYTRVWCCFEVYSTMRSMRADYTYDVYTAFSHSERMNSFPGDVQYRTAVGLLDGSAVGEKDWDTRKKSDRESFFPSALLQNGFLIDLSEGQASVESDRVHILNSIAGLTDLEAPPPSSHREYAVGSDALRGFFAAAMLNRVVKDQLEVRRCLDCISRSMLKKLRLSFHGCSCYAGMVGDVLEVLPETMEELALFFAKDSFGLPERMRSFKSLRLLYFDDCDFFAPLPDWIGELTGLHELWLAGSQRQPNTTPESLSKLKSLRMLTLGQDQELPESFQAMDSLAWVQIASKSSEKKLAGSEQWRQVGTSVNSAKEERFNHLQFHSRFERVRQWSDGRGFCLNVGDLVDVRSQFKSANKGSSTLLAAGHRGSIVEFDADGDAEIDFGDNGKHWVFRSNFENLMVDHGHRIAEELHDALAERDGLIDPARLVRVLRTLGVAENLLATIPSTGRISARDFAGWLWQGADLPSTADLPAA